MELLNLSAYHFLLAFMINRLVETFKQALADEEDSPRVARWRVVWILLVSFVLGILAMIFVFPTYNLFPDASGVIAGLAMSGIVVGGLAQGWDFVFTVGRSTNGVIERIGSGVKTNVVVNTDADIDPAAADIVRKTAREVIR